MIENCFVVSVFCVCSALLAVILRQYCREQSMLAALAACAGILAGSLLFISPVVSEVISIFDEAGVPESCVTLVFKAAAVCCITQITCELCSDCGESAIAAAAGIWGRGALTFMALPLVKLLLERIGELL
ncbi:MAG TPA: hypothetical protein DCZ71_00420 [Ruminococcus sp.]|nr:hypothetical protein [Ruminococcus sp.]